MKKKKASGITPVAPIGNVKVNFYRNEVSLLLPVYFMIRDVIEGEQAIKGMTGTVTGLQPGAGNGGLPLTTMNILVSRAIRYLPQPNAEDQSAANIARYKAYVTRAVFYNATGRTVEGMVGQIFLRDPIVKLPTELEMFKADSNGDGLTLDQLANKCVRHCISFGRTGILVDYPVTNGQVTKQQMADGDIRPTMIVYNPWDIINWRVEMRGAKKVITFVVLREVIDEEGDDGFQLSTFEQYRVLKIDSVSGDHVVEIYSAEGQRFTQTDTFNPTDAKGKPLKEIPFHFVGSENNDPLPDKPPVYDLASLNVAHYRNSADYEESCFIVGQPTPVFTGLDESWVKNILGDSVALGSRTAVPLPVGATAQLLQAKENSMPIEAMRFKEDQMVSLGAKLVKIQKTVKTATQQIIETTSESSPLSNIAKNVSAAFEWALGVAADFVGAAKDSIEYTLNKDFDLTSMTADDQNAVIMQWQKGAIDFSEMRTVLRRAGTATLEDDAARVGIKKDIEAGMIPDPAMAGGSNNVPTPKAPSGAGGPQPGPARTQPSPAGSK